MKAVLGSAWERYRAHCYPTGLDDITAEELRKAFYAGASKILIELRTMHGKPKGAVAQELDELTSECAQFVADMAARGYRP